MHLIEEPLALVKRTGRPGNERATTMAYLAPRQASFLVAEIADPLTCIDAYLVASLANERLGLRVALLTLA